MTTDLRHPDYRKAIVNLIIITLCLVYVMTHAGCMTTSKAVDFLKKKEALAGVCAAEFPVKVDTLTSTDTLTTTDTAYSVDTVQINDTTELTYTIRRNTLTTKTVTITKTIRTENTARVKAQADSLATKDKTIAKQEQQITDRDSKIKSQRKLTWWLIGAIGVLLIYLLRKPLSTMLAKLMIPLANLLPFKK